MKLLPWIVLAFFVLTVGCSTVIHGTVKDDISIYENSRVLQSFRILKDTADKFPKLTKTFEAALEEWKKEIPIEYKITYDNQYNPNAIFVLFCDIQKTMPGSDPRIVGLYDPYRRTILIDVKNNLDNDSDEVFNICVHELGHAFGLPHVIGKVNTEDNELFKYGGVSDIVLPLDSDAQKCIMYPFTSEKRLKLQTVEILWARHFLMHDMNLTACNTPCAITVIRR